MLRAGQLAKLAGVSLPTIKHYVNEGLIPKPIKTGKTMAYYDEACIDRIKLIKKLQKEKFLPLDVIKRALDSGSAYEEELELGQAILKSYKLPQDTRPISERRIEKHTSYPINKIHLLEQQNIVLPTIREGGKYYDAIDCSIIEIMKRREKLGLPFDHSIETIKLYRDAMQNAVEGDIRLFAQQILGDISTKQAVKFMTEVDDLLDNFVVLIRQKMLRRFSQSALTQMNELTDNLDTLSFLPIEGTELPDTPPDDPPHQIIFSFCKSEYDSVLSRIENLSGEKNKPPHIAASVFADLLHGNVESALRTVEQRIPKPTTRTLTNTAAALAYFFSVGEATGFSDPIAFVKRGLAYLRRIEATHETDSLTKLFSQYVCGAIYTMLPDIFDSREAGIRMLLKVRKSLQNGKSIKRGLPEWLSRTLEHEIFPTVEVRVNRFLAEGYLRDGDYATAQQCLGRIIEITDVDDEHSQWARMKKVETGEKRRRIQS